MRSVHMPQWVSMETLEARSMLSNWPVNAPPPSNTQDVVVRIGEGGDPVVSVSGASTIRSNLGGFTWFDGTNGRGTLDWRSSGMSDLLNTHGVTAPGNPNLPDEHQTRTAARNAFNRGATLVINIETWAYNIMAATPTAVGATVARFRQILAWVRDETPQLKVGIYSLFPNRNYWAPVEYQKVATRWLEPGWQNEIAGKSQGVAAWQSANAMLDSLAQQVDIIFPSLYTFYTDQEDWEAYAKWNLEEARRYGKPVVPYLMPLFHKPNPTDPIDAEFWRRQLRFVQQHADGLVIWVPDNYFFNSSTAPWAQVTTEEYDLFVNNTSGAGGGVGVQPDQGPTPQTPSTEGDWQSPSDDSTWSDLDDDQDDARDMWKEMI